MESLWRSVACSERSKDLLIHRKMTLPSILLRPQIAFKYKIETQTFLDVYYKAISKMMKAVISQGWTTVEDTQSHGESE